MTGRAGKWKPAGDYPGSALKDPNCCGRQYRSLRRGISSDYFSKYKEHVRLDTRRIKNQGRIRRLQRSKIRIVAGVSIARCVAVSRQSISRRTKSTIDEVRGESEASGRIVRVRRTKIRIVAGVSIARCVAASRQSISRRTKSTIDEVRGESEASGRIVRVQRSKIEIVAGVSIARCVVASRQTIFRGVETTFDRPVQGIAATKLIANFAPIATWIASNTEFCLARVCNSSRDTSVRRDKRRRDGTRRQMQVEHDYLCERARRSPDS